jgi:FlaA1/EpsC-like NDP-sugar epimerase
MALEPLFYLNEHIRSFDHVVIYGAGGAGKGILMKALQHDIKIDCFADSDPDKCGKKILNVPVLHIKDQAVLDMREDAAVIVGGLYVFDVAPELEKLGFRHIFQYWAGTHYVYLERGV